MNKELGRVPSAPGSRPADQAACGVDGASRFDPSREAALVEAVGRALTNIGPNGYFPGMGAPNTRRLIEAYLAYGKPIEFGRCLK